MVSAAERRDRLRLSLSENVGPVTFRKLLALYGTAGDALAHLPELSRKGGLSRPPRIYGEAEAEADLARGQAMGASAVLAGEAGYPDLLRHIDSAPSILWVKGDVSITARPAAAIVGARNASAAGLKFTRQIASGIGAEGLVIVSGLARGIDTAAHEASLNTGTIAVLAGGLDNIYPPENARLYALIGERGLLVSEMKPGTVPKADHFPRRNRIISGSSQATIVIEAALRSGSLITARNAAEQGREVFAVPGSPLDPRCEGTNRLIRQGATLLTSANDVLEALGNFTSAPLPLREADPEPFDRRDITDSDRLRLVELLSPTPIDLDDLVRESGMSTASATSLLLELELAGKIIRHPQGAVSRSF